MMYWFYFPLTMLLLITNSFIVPESAGCCMRWLSSPVRPEVVLSERETAKLVADVEVLEWCHIGW